MRGVKKAILFITLTGIVLIVWTCTREEPLEEGRCRLKFKALSKHDDMLVTLAMRNLKSTKDKPIEIKDLPKGLTTDCVYFLAKAVGKSAPMVLAYYNRLEYSILYVDTNSNGRLSDEKPYRPKIKKRSGYKEYIFGPFLLKSRDSEGESRTEFYAITNHGQFLSLQPSGYRTGKVRLGENTYKVAVIDGNRDGRYDKIFSLPIDKAYLIGCDVFAIDLNKSDKKWHLSLIDRSEIMPLGRMIKVQNTYYSINVAPDGTTLELKKAEPEFGTLDFGGANVKLKLWSDTGDHYLFGLEGRWPLPAGIYKALFIELEEIDSEQNVWTFSGRPKAGPLRDFEIRADETTSFKIGPPFSIKTDTRQVADQVSIGLSLEGCAEEQYRFPILKGGKQQPAPTFKIVNETGKVLASGQFKYG
jgi:hypothetical protein